jgi:hypothetical protein
MKSKIRIIIREQIENLLKEYQIFDYQKNIDNPNEIQYTFNTDDLKYVVNIIHNSGYHESDVYEVGFGFEGQEHDASRANKDITHLNSVLYTVDKIIEDAVREKIIKKIGFSGARGSDDSHIPFIDPLRTKAYLRFVKNKYPNAKIDKDRFGSITLDMRSIYPEFFKGKKDRKDIFIDELRRISDEEPDDWRIEKNFSLENGRLVGETDAIVNSKLGAMLIGIDSDDNYDEHMLNWIIFDPDEEEHSKDFNSFNELIAFLKTQF